MENKNNSTNTTLIILVVIFAATATILGGYFLFKYIEDENQIQNPNFTLNDAKELMENYKINGTCGDYYLENLSNKILVKELSRQRINTSGFLSFEDVSKTNAYKQAKPVVEKEYAYYTYNNVLNSAKKLFGPDATITKTNDFNNGDSSWFYLEEYDKFVEFEIGFGGDCVVEKNELTVDNFKFKKNELKIYTTHIFNDNTTKTEYTFKLYNNNYYLAKINKM